MAKINTYQSEYSNNLIEIKKIVKNHICTRILRKLNKWLKIIIIETIYTFIIIHNLIMYYI